MMYGFVTPHNAFTWIIHTLQVNQCRRLVGVCPANL
jgi:hypothetical protein